MAPITQGGPLNWTINNFYVLEFGGIGPAEVMPPGAHFHVNIDFDGSGPAWNALELSSAPYRVRFYAERIGPNPGGPMPSERELGTFNGNLAPGGGPYTASLHVTDGIPTEGVYRLGCLMEIVPPSGIVGFDEGLVISVAAGA